MRDGAARPGANGSGRGGEARETALTEVLLGDAVSVRCAVSVVSADATPRTVEALVELPEDARAMLEAVTWRRGATIVESLRRFAARCLERPGGVTALCDAPDAGARLIRIRASAADV